MIRKRQPIARIVVLLLTAASLASAGELIDVPEIDGYHEFNYGRVNDRVEQWAQAIRVWEPELRSEIRGDVTVRFQAPGMTRACALCWRQTEPPDHWGEDVNLTPGGIVLDAQDNGSFVFHAERFPHGPINVRIYAHNGKDRKDIFELQLFNLGGVVWNQGIPDHDPPAAKGLRLVYADDFDGPVSISNDGRGAKYMAHKPGGGDFSGWPFSNVLGDGKPFGRKETWLRIAARKNIESPRGRTGILASVNGDFQGIWAKAPCYLECRFTAQSAIGTWPAFWTLALGDEGTDELDVVEAYGGKGKGNPNHPGYSIVSHFWRQKNPGGTDKTAVSTRVPIMELGGNSYWSSTFHTYGVYVGLDETVYYFDDVYVYLGADANQGSGSVTISSASGGVDPNGTYFYWKRWLDGLFVVSKATSLEKTEPSNCVVFKENTAEEFDIEWAGNLKDGWTGVSGVQIVERPYTPQGIRIDCLSQCQRKEFL